MVTPDSGDESGFCLTMNDEKYPNEIDLGREVPDYGSPTAAPSDAKEETRTVYPTLYISDCPGLKDLPEEGCCMIRYKRVRLRTEEVTDEDGTEENTSCELEIHAICHGDEEGDEESDDGDLAEGIAKVLAEHTKE